MIFLRTSALLFISASLTTVIVLAMGKKAQNIADSKNPLLREMTCEQLIEKSNDEKFSLKNLAGLRAHRDCKDFRFDWRNLPDIEKRIYSAELELVDPNAKPASSSLSVADLRKSLKTEKDDGEKFRLYKQIRQKLRNNGQKTESVKVTTELYNWTLKNWKAQKKVKEKDKDPIHQARHLEAALTLGRTLWTENQTSKAESILSATVKNLKEGISLAEVYLLQGRIAEQQEKFTTALEQYDLALADNKKYGTPGNGFDTNRVIWLKSWILYKTEKWGEASASFKELADQTADLSEKSRARFYRARAMAKIGQFDESKKLLTEITQDDFFTYYSLVAYHALGQKLPAISQIKPAEKFPFDLQLTFLDEKNRTLFYDLIKYGELDIAEKAIGVLPRGTNETVNMSLELAAKGQRYLPLFASFAKLDNSSKIDLILKHGQHLFPRVYEDKVKAMSEKTSLPTSLIYSIMKQESAFNEKTRSAADAFGLMQVIPRLAKHLAKKYEVPYSSQSDLYNPEINIQLGSYELQDQVRKQSGQLTFVAAAYNAGPNALAGWVKRRDNFDMLEFIEDIPFEETRTYVKIIARNKLFYERLEKPDIEQSFPSEFLTIPDFKSFSSSTEGAEPFVEHANSVEKFESISK